MDLKKAILHNEVTGVAFGFYTPEEIRQISVRQITNPQTFDTLGNPLDGGTLQEIYSRSMI
jgi:DNA-directed RNA polymerase I subunit RPA1